MNSDWVRDPRGEPVQFGDSTSIDAFGRLRVSQQFGYLESKLISNGQPGLWSTRVFGMIVNHGTVTGGPFQVNETVTSTNGKRLTVTIVGATSLTVNTWDGLPTGTLTGLTSGATAAVVDANTGAYCVHDYNKSAMTMAVGTLSGQRVVRRTLRYFPYVSGYGLRNMNTVNMGPFKANLCQTVMFGDDLNGIGYRADGLDMTVFIRSNTSGSPVEDVKTQAQFNYDRLDGSGPSGLTWDPEKNQITDITFEWLGLGTAELGVIINKKAYPIHRYEHANLTEGVYMRTPTLPASYEIENIGVTASPSSMDQICTTVGSEGGYQLPGYEFSALMTFAQQQTVTNTRRPVMAIRLKNNFPAGKPNRRTVRLIDIEFVAQSNAVDIELRHVHDPLTMTATWNDADTNGSAVEYSVDIAEPLTFIDSHLIQAGKAFAGGGAKSDTSSIDTSIINYHNFLSQNYESNNSQMFVVYATAATAVNAQVSGHMTWVEFE